MGIDTYLDPVLYMRRDCPVCRSEGFEARTRVKVMLAGRSVIATLNVVDGSLLTDGEAGLSEAAWRALGAVEGAHAQFGHPDPIASDSRLRAKVYGGRLDDADMQAIISDVVQGQYSELQLAAFITACAGNRLDEDETIALTRAMVRTGERLSWQRAIVADKHSVGGLPGNRTTPLVVAMVAAHGVMIPKTSSRAITSPAGTVDTMETLAPVDLDLATMRRVVEREGGCVAWGGAVQLSPADDQLIRVEAPLDLDSDGQLVASVISKKAAAGATHVVIDMPVGPTAKVRSDGAASALSRRLRAAGAALGMTVRVLRSSGLEPIGHGIGPALEARDVLAVLRRHDDAPRELRAKSITLAGAILEMAGAVHPGTGASTAAAILDDGRAWTKFQRICEAQGGMRVPPRSRASHVVLATASGTVTGFDNRRLAKVAKLAGAPAAKAAGIDLHVRIGSVVARHQPLLTLHAEAPGELDYALRYFHGQAGVVVLDPS
jgi:thymidine phosphorylase